MNTLQYKSVITRLLFIETEKKRLKEILFFRGYSNYLKSEKQNDSQDHVYYIVL